MRISDQVSSAVLRDLLNSPGRVVLYDARNLVTELLERREDRKGWRPPAQVITDPDTLDIFPARTVGIDRDGEVWVSRFTDWVVAFDPNEKGERLSDIVSDFGPLTIVYVPTEEADRG